MRPIYIFLVLQLLFGCVSAPKISYYLLDTSSKANRSLSIEIVRLELSDYLDSRDVVIELESGSIHQANFHKWSEPLGTSVLKSLEYLEGGSDSIRVELVIDRFHGTEDGYVLLAGRWRVENGAESGEWLPFDFRESVSKAGYAAMIAAESGLLERLAMLMESELVRDHE